MTNKLLGKIESISFGFGGYQDAMIGLTLTISGKGWGVTKFISGGWNSSIKVDKYTKWTEEDRNKDRANCIREIDIILNKAKVSDITKLCGIPVEVTFKDNLIADWRILEEVL